MKLQIILRLALKNLWSHRLRTILTISGVTIGIASIIFLVSLGYGLEQLVTNQVANFNAFTIVDVPSANVSTIKIDRSTIDKISGFGHVDSIAAVTNLAGRIRKQDNSSTAETVVTGGDANYWKLAGIAPEEGELPEKPDEIVLNKSAINLVGESSESFIGKTINLDIIIPAEMRTESSAGLKVTSSLPLKVVGTLKDDKSPVVLITLDLLAKEDATKYSALKLKVDNKNNISSVRKQLENIGLATEYVGDTVSQINQVFSLFRGILAAFGLVAMVVAALGMFNTLTISLLERVREIGLFKALGMRKKDVYKLFLAESLIIGTFGGFLGLALGYCIGTGIDELLSYLARRSNAELISIFHTPLFFALAIAVFSILVGFMTGWYPSKRAVKIDPLDALRYE